MPESGLRSAGEASAAEENEADGDAPESEEDADVGSTAAADSATAACSVRAEDSLWTADAVSDTGVVSTVGAKNRLRGSAYARAPPHQPLPQHSGEQRAAQGALRAHGLSAHRSPRRERPVRQASPPFFFFSFRHLLSAPRHMPAALLFPHAVDNSSVLFFNITRAAGSTQQHESPAQRHHTAAGITRTSA